MWSPAREMCAHLNPKFERRKHTTTHRCRARHPSFQATQTCRREYVHLATIARDDDEDIARRSPRRSRAAARSPGRVMRVCDRRVDARVGLRSLACSRAHGVREGDHAWTRARNDAWGMLASDAREGWRCAASCDARAGKMWMKPRVSRSPARV